MDYSLLLGFHFTDREDSPYYKSAGINNVNVNNTNLSDPNDIDEDKPLMNSNTDQTQQAPASTSGHRGRKDSKIKQMHRKKHKNLFEIAYIFYFRKISYSVTRQFKVSRMQFKYTST